MNFKVTEDMIEAALAAYEKSENSGETKPNPEAFRAALEAVLAHPDAETEEGVDWYLFQAWSARIEDGKLVPHEQISGNGIHYEIVSGKPGYLEMQRIHLEKIGRIEKGAPYFCIEAPFRLMKGDVS